MPTLFNRAAAVLAAAIARSRALMLLGALALMAMPGVAAAQTTYAVSGTFTNGSGTYSGSYTVNGSTVSNISVTLSAGTLEDGSPAPATTMVSGRFDGIGTMFCDTGCQNYLLILGNGGNSITGFSGPCAGSSAGVCADTSGTSRYGNGARNTVVIPSVTISVSPASVSEDGATNLTYTVTRSSADAAPLTVNLSASGTATSGADYTGAVTSVIIPANATTTTFALDPTVDGTVEADETVTMTVATGSGYTIGVPSTATGTILNDDVPSATISRSPAQVAEDGAPNLVFTVTLNQASFSATSLAYTVTGTATNGTDYATIASPLVIPAGNTTGTITVNPTADATIEADETVTLTLAAGAGYTVGVPNAATGTILNDDLPNLTINDVTANEGNAGTTNFVFTVSLSAPAGPGGVTFDIATAAGAAAAGVDFVGSNLTSQTIPAGSSTYTFTVLVNGDTTFESTETFFVNVTSVLNAVVVDGQGVGTIVNDDVAAPTVAAIAPNTGPAEGGTSVVITGTNLAGTTAVNFGPTAATAITVNSATQITATSPPGSGTVDVTVTTSGGTSAASPADQFTYVAAPTVTALAPATGPTAGGGTVVVTGTNFAGTTAVTFGATPATGFTVNSATQITATAPAGTGTVDVRVTTAGGTSSTAGTGNDYRYAAAPTVTFVSPNGGSTVGGGAVIFINGTGFTGATAVSFGANPAVSFTVNSDNDIQAVVPAGAAGTVDIRVTTPGGTSAITTADQFTYYPPVTVTGVSPTGSPTTGGTTVVITGSNFIGANRVVFGGTNATSYTVDSNTQITAVTPARGSTGSVFVTVTTPGNAGSLGGGFTYYIPRTVRVTAPATITEGDSGTTNSTWTLSLDAASAVPITVGYATVAGTATTDDFLPVTANVTIPAGSTSATVTVPVVGDVRDEDDETFSLQITSASMGGMISGANGVATATITDDDAPPSISIADRSFPEPNFGAANLSFLVTLSAPSSKTVTVDYASADGTATAPSDYSPASGTLTFQPGETSRSVGVDMIGDTDFEADETLFMNLSSPVNATIADGQAVGTLVNTDVAPPAISAVSPASGPLAGGTLVTLTGTNLTGASAVTFGGTPATGVTVVSPTQITALTPAGSGTVDVVVTTAGGPSAIGSSARFTYVAAPAAPVVTTPSNGALTNDTTPTYSGTAQAGATVDLMVDGAPIGAVTADGSGNWTLTPVTALADGTHDVRAIATNAGGTSPVSAISVFTVDATAPAAPVVTSPAAGAVLMTANPTYSGSAEPNATVTVSVDGSAVGATTASGAGSWSLSQPVPLAAGGHTVRATATDAAGNASPQSTIVSFTYSPLTLSGGALAGGQVGVAYSTTLTATGGTSPVGYAVTAGALPPGLSLSSGGTLSGRPTLSGAFAFTVTATDAASLSTSGAYTLTVAAPAPPVANPETTTVIATGGTQAVDLSGAVAGAASIQIVTPPAHGTATVSGLTVNYVPEPGYFGAVTFTYKAIGFADGGAAAGESAPATVTINIPSPTLVLAGGSLPGATVGTSYNGALTASGGTAPYTYAVTTGSLPTGVTLSQAGVLSGTPTAGGAFAFSVTATDASTGAGPFSITSAYELAVAAPAITVDPAALSGGTAGIAYSQTLSASGGVAPYAWSVSSGALPAGLTLSPAGVLTGTPTVAGTFNFTAVATDSATGSGPFSGARAYTLVIAAPTIVLTPANLANARVGAAYEQTLSANGGTAPYAFSVTSGALPQGLSLTSTGALTGTPTAGGSFNIVVTARDALGFEASAPYTLVVDAAVVTVTPNTAPTARRGFAYSQAFTATGGTGAYSWSVASGALPAGLTLSTAGVLSGTPTVVGNFPVQIRATDQSTGSGPYSGAVDVTVVVTGASVVVMPTSLPSVMAGAPYDQALTASGGAGGYTFAVTAGTLPSGITLSPSGRLAGASYSVGASAFTVTATDGFGNIGSANLQIVVETRPDPAADPDVQGTLTAQTEATRRMVSTQIDNFSRRLEQLHQGGAQQSSMGVSLASGVVSPELSVSLPGLFGDQRQSLQGDVAHADVAELRAMIWPDNDRGTAGAINGDRLSAADQTRSGPVAGPRVWTGGVITVGERDGETGVARLTLRTGGLSVGADVSLSPNLDVGVGGGFGEESADIGELDTRVESRSLVGVFYGSYRPAPGLAIDALGGVGQLEFDSRRRVVGDGSLVMGRREGSVAFGSLSIGTDRQLAGGQFGAYGRVELMSAQLDAYTEAGSALWALRYEERDVDSLQGVFGLAFSRTNSLRSGAWTPSIRFEYRREFGEAGEQAIRYADWLSGPRYSVGDRGFERDEFSLDGGLRLNLEAGWAMGGEAGIRWDDRTTSGTLRLMLQKTF